MNRIYSGLSQTGQFLLGLYPFLRLIRLSQICLVDAVSKKISKHKQILKKKKTPFALSRYYFGAWDTYDDVTVCLWARFQGQVCEFYSIGIHIFCLFHCNFFLSFFFFFLFIDVNGRLPNNYRLSWRRSFGAYDVSQRPMASELISVSTPVFFF